MKFSRVLIALVIGAISTMSATAQPIDSAAQEASKTRIAVLLNYRNVGTTAEALRDALARQNPTPEDRQWVQRFQAPVSSRLLINAGRRPQALRENLTDDNPDEILHRYIVLEFKDRATTIAAMRVLEKDSGVLYVQDTVYGSLLAAPSDPLYQYSATGPQDWQWAINDTMSMQLAWNTVRGTAYLAHLDNGIQTRGGLGVTIHEDLTQPLRRFKLNATTGGITNADVDENPAGSGGFAGHGTHVAGIMAAATSQSGVAAGYPNPPNVGVAGTCWYCSLLVAKVTVIVNGAPSPDFTTAVPNAIYWAVNSGAQVINMSFGGQNPLYGGIPDPNCTANPYHTLCAALASAAAKQVVVVAAAGNSDRHHIPAPVNPGAGIGTMLDFPASHPSTIAVAAAQWYTTVGHPTRINLWTEESWVNGFVGTSGGPGMSTRGVLAPGRDILSTFYDGINWNTASRCGIDTTFPLGTGTTRGPQYG